MKTLFVSILALLACFRISAQVSVDLALDQQQFLPNEPIRLAVKITNVSGQQIHLGTDPLWLTFNVESDDGFVVIKNSEVPVVDPFDLESSQMATKRVDLEPYFQMGKPGRYKVTATMRMKDWSLTVNSTPLTFDVISGVELWAQNFGVMVASNLPPESRKFVLMKANYLHEQLRLYAEVINSDGSRIYKVSSLGPLVMFGSPEEQIDRFSQLHVLWKTGAHVYSYVVLSADGTVVNRDFYDDFGSHPSLTVNGSGDVVVRGAVRHGQQPQVKAPDTSPAALTNP